MLFDAGICHQRETKDRFMYSGNDLASYAPDVDLMETPVRIFNPRDTSWHEITLRAFNDGYVVDQRFEMRDINRSFHCARAPRSKGK